MTLSEWRIGLPSVHAHFGPNIWPIFGLFLTRFLLIVYPFWSLFACLTCACRFWHAHVTVTHLCIRAYAWPALEEKHWEILRNIEWKSLFETSQVSWSTWNTFESYLKRRCMDLHGPLNNVLLQAKKIFGKMSLRNGSLSYDINSFMMNAVSK